MVCPDPETAVRYVQLSDWALGDMSRGAAVCCDPRMPVAPTQVSGWAIPFYLQLLVRGSFCSVCVQLSLHYLCAPTVFFTSCHLNCGSATATVTGAEAHMRPNALVKIRRSQNRLFQSGIVR